MHLTKLCASAGSILEVGSRDQGFPVATIFGDSDAINVPFLMSFKALLNIGEISTLENIIT